MTVSRQHLAIVLARYLADFPDRAAQVERLVDAIDLPEEDPRLDLRETLPLHVTVSAAVLDDETDDVLMLHHRPTDRYWLPGGHLHPHDLTLYGAALRHLEEMAGIPWQEVVSAPPYGILPVDIDIHEVRADPEKGEPEHVHADFRFPFWPKEFDINVEAEDKVTVFTWQEPARLPTARLALRVCAL